MSTYSTHSISGNVSDTILDNITHWNTKTLRGAENQKGRREIRIDIQN